MGELSCRVVHGTGTKWIVGLCGKVMDSSEVDCGPHLGLEERCCEVWWHCTCGKLQRWLQGIKLRTVWKTPWLAVAAVEQHLGIISLTITTVNFSFCSLQGEILHRLQADLGHLGSMD